MMFFGCSSTPEEEVIEPVEPTDVIEVPVDNVEPVIEGVTEGINKSSLEAVALAREAAVLSGAATLFTEEFEKLETEYEAIKQAIASDSAMDRSKELADIQLRYQAMERLATATKMRSSIEENDFTKIDESTLAQGDASVVKAKDLLFVEGSGSSAKSEADSACKAYESLLLAGFKGRADSVRGLAYESKEKADSIKSNKGDKEGYSAAALVLSGADAAYVEKNYETAYFGFQKANELFDEVYKRVLEKRAAAEEAIARAKQKVDTTAVFAAEADEIAPLQEVEK